MSSDPSRVSLVARPSRNDVAIGLSIIIPAYNEVYRLPAALQALRHHVDPTTTEIIVVDDGSDDETSAVARRGGEWAKHLVVIRHEQNQGKGAAVRTGVAAARGDVIGFIDADNATDLAALAPMIDALSPTVAAVFGSRHAPGSEVTGSPAIRGLMGRVFNHVVKAAAGTTIRDTQCGAKVFSAPAARLAFSATAIDGFAFDVEILRRLLAMGFGVIEYPVKWHYVHGTKIQLTTPLLMLRDIARIRLARTTDTPQYVDTTFVPEFAFVSDLLQSNPAASGPELNDGAAVRLFAPFDAEQVLGLVRSQDQAASLARSTSWTDL